MTQSDLPTDEPEQVRQARLLSLSGDYVAAIERLEAWLHLFPNDIGALVLKGNVFELQAYSTSLDEGLSFLDSSELRIAKSCYEAALALESENVDALTDLANLLEQAKQYRGCVSLLNKALLLLKAKGDDVGASEVLVKIEEISPKI